MDSSEQTDTSLLLNINIGDTAPTASRRTFGNDKKKRIKQRQFLKMKGFISSNREARAELGTLRGVKTPKESLSTGVTAAKGSSDGVDTDDYTPAVKKSKSSVTKPPQSHKDPQLAGKPQQKGQPKQHVISSLFNKNPDIPSVTHVDMKQAKVNVFTKTTFSELPLHPHLISCLDKMCLTEMTEVQQQTIPHLLQGKDLLVRSQTGSGKTLSYAVPLIQRLRSKPQRIQRADGVFAVVLVPTRELALQSLAVIKKLVQSCIWIVPGMVIGGESRKSEKARLRKGVNILVATPGRLVDHCSSTTSLSFHHLEYLIIDEADRLLDMGFEKDVSKLMSCIQQQTGGYDGQQQGQREEREEHSEGQGEGEGEGERLSGLQTVLLSATLSTDVKRLASVALTNPVVVNVSSNANSVSNNAHSDNSEQPTEMNEGTYSLPSSLKQYYIITPSKLRLVSLTAFILDKCKHAANQDKVIVFLPSQEVVQFYYRLFVGAVNSGSRDDSSDVSDDEEDSSESKLFDVFALHGDMEQKYRTEVYKRFSKATSGVLLCTDVAARGLDLPNVNWIVQLSPPASTEDYVHRVGRTARIGIKGNALLFLLPSEVKYLEILNTAKISLKSLEVDSVLKSCLVESSSLPKKLGSKRSPHTVQEAATALQQSLEEWTYNEEERLAQAKSAYQSFVRSYATYPTKVKDIFHIKYLHLGHLAKSFCLREAPAGLKGSATSTKLDKRSRAAKKIAAKTSKHKRRYNKMSEFSSG